jgi:hypothetical protein
MKTTLLKSIPFLVLTGSLLGQVAPSPAPASEPLPPPGLSVIEEPPPQITSLKLDGAPLRDAIEIIQNYLEERKLQPINVVLSVPKGSDIRVPALTLRNVSGPDALMLIVTAAGLEMKPIMSTDQLRVVGWEICAPPAPARMKTAMGQIIHMNSGGGWGVEASAAAPSSVMALPPPLATTTEPAPPAPLAPGSTPTPVPAAGVNVGTEGVSGKVPVLSELPVVGRVFTAGAPAPTLSLDSSSTITAPALSPNARDTRVYALGTVTTYASFADVEKTLRDMLEADGIKPSDVTLSFHEKTNVLVANGTMRAHGLIDQLVQALSRDISARDAQNKQGAIRDLQQAMDSRTRALDQAEEQIQELRKAFNQAEAARVKSDLELKLLKDRESNLKPQPR